MPPQPRSTSTMSRAVAGVLCATLASIAALAAGIFVATIDVPAGEGDSWIRGAIGLILVAPVLVGVLVGYYAVAAIMTYFIRRWRLAGLVALAVVASSAFAIWAAPHAGRYDVLAGVSSLLFADLLLGSGVLYFVYARRLRPAARS